MVKEIMSAILWLVLEFSPCPNCPLAKDQELLFDTADSIVRISLFEKVDPYLVLAISFRETSLRRETKGDIGELGLMQVAPTTLAYCEKKGINTEKHNGRLHCGVFYLKQCMQKCKSLKKSLALYGTGKTCNYMPKSVKKGIDKKIKLYKKLKERIKNDRGETN